MSGGILRDVLTYLKTTSSLSGQTSLPADTAIGKVYSSLLAAFWQMIYTTILLGIGSFIASAFLFMLVSQRLGFYVERRGYIWAAGTSIGCQLFWIYGNLYGCGFQSPYHYVPSLYSLLQDAGITWTVPLIVTLLTLIVVSSVVACHPSFKTAKFLIIDFALILVPVLGALALI